jgi:hypothetical protein
VVSGTCASGNSLLVNGDFSQGNVGFTSDYALVAPPAQITPAGEYAITQNPGNGISTWSDWGSFTAPGGSGNMLAANGATTPNSPVWIETVPVEPGTTYTFSYSVAKVDDDDTNSTFYATLQTYVNSVPVGNPYTLNSAFSVWTQYSTTWSSGTSTSATISIVDTTDQDTWNDFALDLLSFCSD